MELTGQLDSTKEPIEDIHNNIYNPIDKDKIKSNPDEFNII